MPNIYQRNTKNFSQPHYSTLSGETKYKCQGSCCSCRVLENRTEFDSGENKDYIENKFVFDLNKFQKLPQRKLFGSI